jgi:1-aminocyclopropane-1-carboxylate deaminase
MISLPTIVPLSDVNNEYLIKNNISLSILRLDMIHENVSGNKLFKLFYFLKECLKTNHTTLLTFGGAYSNHLAATAHICQANNIKCIGIIRGEEPAKYSHTLNDCKQKGMELHFIPREQYKNSDNLNFINGLKLKFGEFTMVPEGGFDKLGALGASHIFNLLEHHEPTHICVSVGTATTLAGLLLQNKNIQVIAIPAIKNMTDVDIRINTLIGNYEKSILQIFDEYHFGGYAKHNAELIAFMNEFYIKYKIPTDIIYTAKMMYGVMDKINKGYFEAGSKIICVHTGGLQGNKSLPGDALLF